MTVSNRAYALLGLAQWCRQHGIYEMREVLQQAAQLAAAADSGEDLAVAMEQMAFKPETPEVAAQADEPAKPQEHKTTPKIKAKTPS